MEIKVFDLGLIDYKTGCDFQKKVFLQVKSGELKSALIFCRHNPVITLGRSASKSNILATDEQLIKNNIAVYEVERGGDVTYHGPGQLTVYPVLNLNYLKKDIHWILRVFEDAVIGTLAEFGITASKKAGLTGAWVGNKKICSIGIAIKNWITYHGLTINIKDDDLRNFELIRPCGMDVEMTSLETLLGKRIEFEDVRESIAAKMHVIASPAYGGAKQSVFTPGADRNCAGVALSRQGGFYD